MKILIDSTGTILACDGQYVEIGGMYRCHDVIHYNADDCAEIDIDLPADFHPSRYLVVDGELVRRVIPKTRDQLKVERQAAVEAIKVTTTAGHTFDGDETSQTRMTRAIIALQATGTPTVTWVLADNTVIEATAAELTEALALAGAAQAAVWVIE